MTYQEQLKHPLWQAKRLEVLKVSQYICQECGATQVELHVHHVWYRKGCMAWEYEADQLVCLCKDCHIKTHIVDDMLKERLSSLSIQDKMAVVGYLDANDGATMWFKDNPDYVKGFEDANRTTGGR